MPTFAFPFCFDLGRRSRALVAVFAAFAAMLSAGCAVQPPIPMSAGFGAMKEGKVGVAISTLPKVTTSFPGAGPVCLLCMAAAALSNQPVTAHVERLPADDLLVLAPDIAKRLRSKGIDAIAIDAPLDLSTLVSISQPATSTAQRDFRPLRDKHGVDRLVVFEVRSLGVVRNYSNYFPVSEPLGHFDGVGYVVNLKTNMLEWWLPIEVRKAVAGKWDDPPKFPGLTNAYFFAIEEAKDNLTRPFDR